MFRPMRKSNQQLPEAECIEILKSEPRGVLSLLGDEGYPYGLPMDHWYCEDDGKLYFHCGKQGHKIDAIHACDKASFCVMDPGVRKDGDWALTVRSVIVFGRVAILDNQEQAIQITRRLSYKYTSDSAYIEEEIQKYGAGVLVFSLTPEHITGKTVHEA